MLYISESESSQLVTHELAFKAVRDAFISVCEQDTTLFPVVLAHGSLAENQYSVKASSTAELAGLKIGSYWPRNQERGLARHNSLILLFDQNVGKIAVAIEAGKVNAFRTAAADAVAASALARAESETLVIFGTGHQARYECAALVRVRPIRRILVVARDAAKGKAMVADLESLSLDVQLSDAKDACLSADILVTATTARAPLFDAAWIRPGTHLASIGSDSIGKQELPAEIFGRAKLFCDFEAQSRRIGEFQHVPSDTPITPIGEVLAGRQRGRCSADEITVFDSSGLSVQDLYIGSYLLIAKNEIVALKEALHS